MRRSRILGLTAVGGAGAWAFVEPHLPVLRRRDIAVLPHGAAPIRLLHLSDLHLLPRHTVRAAWVRGLARLEPHLVVSTGDHLSSTEALPLLVGTLAAFDAPGYFVPGNNDYYSPRAPVPWRYFSAEGALQHRVPDLPWPEAAAGLVEAGWTDLTHVRKEVIVAGTPITLTGTDDAHLRRDRYALVAGPVTGTGIGITHTPARRVLDAMTLDGHALLLAGHTHGGQVRLPLGGAMVTNCDLPRRQARGLTRRDGAWLHVSAGLGTSPYAPVRFCCRPEATLLTLLPTGQRSTTRSNA